MAQQKVHRYPVPEYNMVVFPKGAFPVPSPWLILVFLILTTLLPAAASSAETKAPLEGQESSIPDKESSQSSQPQPGLQSLMQEGEQLAKKMVDLQFMLDSLPEPQGFQNIMEQLATQIQDLEWQVTMAAADPNLASEPLVVFAGKLAKIESRLEKQSLAFKEDLALLIAQHTEWTGTVKQIKDKIEQLEGSETYRLLENNILEMLELSQHAVDLITQRLMPMSEANTYANTLQVKLYTLKSDLRNAITENQEEYFQQTSPPIYSDSFYTKLHFGLLEEMGKRTIAFGKKQTILLQQNLPRIGILALVTIILWRLIRLSRGLIPASYRWYTINRYPSCSAIFFSVLSYIFLWSYLMELSTDLVVLIYFLFITALFFIRYTLEMEPWINRFFSRTLIFLAVTLLIDAISGPPVIFRLYVIASTIYGIVFCLQMNATLKKQNQGLLSRTMFKATALFLLIMLIAAVIGFDQLSRYIFIGFIKSVAAGLVCWLLLLYTDGLLEFVVKTMPLNFLSRYGDTISRQLRPLFWAAYILVFMLWVRQIWLLEPDTSNVLKKLLGYGIPIFSWNLTVGFVLTISAVLYGTYLISSWLQTALLQEIMPRYRLERGVQLSISRIVHYVIFFIGFVVLLKILGLELTQLTILGGALGVGIGFGLQAIVNNFVSGLILLFERPVKVGDTIQIGQEWGEIKSLGLRATIVQTFDNAEIVIPNGDLITNQVTNWTLGERRVRVKIPVGVAYGTDISEVLAILLKSANGHPLVLSTPKPVALFLAFGASSLDFELRVWIPNVDDKLTVLSELNQEIDSEFGDAGIVIPFPQRDVHLYTTDTGQNKE